MAPTPQQRQENCLESEASLVYRVLSRNKIIMKSRASPARRQHSQQPWRLSPALPGEEQMARSAIGKAELVKAFQQLSEAGITPQNYPKAKNWM